MAKKKTTVKSSWTDLSSAELYELAKKKEQEERKQAIDANKEKIKALRAQRKKIEKEYEKELKKIDAEIARLGGRVSTSRAGRMNVTDAVISVLEKKGEISSKELKAELQNMGLGVDNLMQTLAYLKGKERIVSPARAVYRLP